MNRTIHLCAALITFLLLWTTTASGQLPAALPHPNLDLQIGGSVNAIVRQPDGGMVFGGAFSSVNGLPRSNIARVLPTGQLDPVWDPAISAPVLALATDSSGAVYVGGEFTAIDGLPRSHIAKLAGSGSGTVDAAWDPAASSIVWALLVDGGSVYAGGYFDSIGGQSRSRIAKLSSAGAGAADPAWNPGSAGGVLALAVNAGSVYAAGEFLEIGGLPRNFIAKLSASGSGTVDSNWDPAADGVVRTLAVRSTGEVYAGGQFTSIGGQPRNFIAKLAGSGTGVADPQWNPAAEFWVTALALDQAGGVYAGGEFISIGGLPRQRIAKLSDSGSGAADASFNPSADRLVNALALGDNNSLWVGGSFAFVGNSMRLGLAQVDAAGALGAPLHSERAGAAVFALTPQQDGGVIVGGRFQRAGGLDRANVLRLLPNGQIDPSWNPSANGEVRALAVDSAGAIYIGGFFTRMGGLARSHIARTSEQGATDASWSPNANNAVLAVSLDTSGSLYVGGEFTNIGGRPRSNIAKLSTTGTGAADAGWNPVANRRVLSLAVDGSWVYAGGAFSSIGGQPRSLVAKLASSGAGAADASWNPIIDDPFSSGSVVSALALDGLGSLYIGGSFFSVNAQPRGSIAKLSVDGSGAADPVWSPDASGTVTTLALDQNGSLYAGGNFAFIGGALRNRIAKLSAVDSGAADPNWDPSVSSASPTANTFVHTLALFGEAVLVGGFFTDVGTQNRSSLAAVPVPVSLFRSGFEN